MALLNRRLGTRTRLACALAACCASVLLSGCPSIPQKELKAYRDAFDQARTGSQEVIMDYGAAKAEVDKRVAARAAAKAKPVPAAPPPLFPASYKPAVTSAATKGDGVSERIRALEVIARYNQVLADLAEGKSVEQVQSGAQQLVGALQGAVNLAPGVGPLVSDLAGAIEKARTRAEFAEAVRKGEQSVNKIFDFLMEEIPKYYEIRVDLTIGDLSAIEDRIDGRLEALKKTAESVRPGMGIDLSKYQDQINGKLGKLVGMNRTAKLTAGQPKTGEPAATASQTALTEGFISKAVIEFDDDTSDYLATAGKLNTYMGLLQKYERLLDSTKKAMSALRIAVDSPQDVSQQFEDVLQTSILLRRDFINLRGQL